MPEEEQSWENCRHSVPVNNRLGQRLKLPEHGFHELYCCSCPELKELGIYPIVESEDGEVSLLLDIDPSRSLAMSDSIEPYIRPGAAYFGILQDTLETGLRPCKHCKFYKTK